MPPPCRIRGFTFPQGGPPVFLASLPAADPALAAGQPVWLDVEGDPAEAENWLRARLGWHPIVLQNIRQVVSRARLTPFDDHTHLAFVVRAPIGEGGDDTEIDAVLGEKYLVTFHARPLAAIDALLEELPAAKAHRSPDIVLYRLVSAAVEAEAPRVESLEDVLAELEQDALARPRPDLLEEIVATRDALYAVHLSLAPQQQMLRELASGSRFVTPYARPFFRSLENRLRGLIDDVAIYREVAQNALELYRSSITHKTNETIRVLTVLSTPLLVLSFITGLYGMNVGLPYAETSNAFAVIFGVSGAVFLAMLAWFKKRQWF